jgi:hypothetical protein
MVVYQCSKCNKEFDKKANWVYHTQKRKSSCVDEDETNGTKCYKTVMCYFCKKTFSRDDSLERHLLTCKIKINGNDTFAQSVDDQIQAQYHSPHTIVYNVNNTVNTINTISNTISMNNYNTIHVKNANMIVNPPYNLRSFGSENLDSIDQSDVKKILCENSGANIITKCLTLIYMNNEIPENQNIYVSDNVRKNVRFYSNGIWVNDKLTNVLNIIFSKCAELIILNYSNMIHGSTTDECKKIKNGLDTVKQLLPGNNLITKGNVNVVEVYDLMNITEKKVLNVLYKHKCCVINKIKNPLDDINENCKKTIKNLLETIDVSKSIES